ncbi:MAG: biotin synthase BioB, partial [Deltaproteobacteria bacterium]|nr:biotin synthase BioB [Deltaproteobacteria bacterium]
TADSLRRDCIGNRVTTCSIINAKSGRCSEDCAFCAQSGRHATALTNYPLMNPDEMLEHAEREERHSLRCGIVTAGRGMSPAEITTVCEAVDGFKKRGLQQRPCASLGFVNSADFKRLKAAGLKRFHHNLEASRAFFPRICTTHTYDERIETIQSAKAAGLEVCVGAIFGLGESDNDRVDVLEEIRQLDPAAVPLNFLVPIEGTPLAGRARMPRWEAIRIIALARFLMPRKDILIGGGRLEVFGDEQHLIFKAGANAMIVGDLLTVKGRAPDADMALLKELGLELSL